MSSENLYLDRRWTHIWELIQESTTTKFVLLDEEETLLYAFYAPNEGNPLMVAKSALLELKASYEQAGAKLNILAAGTTGYGELLFANAFDTECHVVETVAHTRAARKIRQGRKLYPGYRRTGHEGDLGGSGA